MGKSIFGIGDAVGNVWQVMALARAQPALGCNVVGCSLLTHTATGTRAASF
jgi:hypothetical protein